MKISVIIPTYNRSQQVLNAIRSVQEQSFEVDEIIIIDDGSNDDTAMVLKDLNIKYHFISNQGVSKARNKGIKVAKNSWLAFLDSDDTWHKDKILEHVNLHEKDSKLLASYTAETWIRNNKVIKLKAYQQKEEPSFLNSLRLCKIGVSSFFCNKSIFEDVSLFDESLLACEDYDLWLRILLKNKIAFIDKELVNKYAGHENQLSFSTKLIDTYRIQALEKHLDSKYKKEVLEELIYKLEILLKGAKKHNNIDILTKYEKKLSYFSEQLLLT